MTFLPQQSRFHVRKRITWFLAGVAIFGGRIVNTPPEIKLFLKVKISLDIEVAKNQDFRREFMHKKMEEHRRNLAANSWRFCLDLCCAAAPPIYCFSPSGFDFCIQNRYAECILTYKSNYYTRKYNVHNNYLIRVCTVRDLFLIYYIRLHII